MTVFATHGRPGSGLGHAGDTYPDCMHAFQGVYLGAEGSLMGADRPSTNLLRPIFSIFAHFTRHIMNVTSVSGLIHARDANKYCMYAFLCLYLQAKVSVMCVDRISTNLFRHIFSFLGWPART